jgi:hypothetical protein
MMIVCVDDDDDDDDDNNDDDDDDDDDDNDDDDDDCNYCTYSVCPTTKVIDCQQLIIFIPFAIYIYICIYIERE